MEGSDRRGARRVFYMCDVECESGAPDPLTPRMRDLSATGAFIESETPVPLGTHLTLRFTVPAGELLLAAEVVRHKPPGMGVRFSALTDSQRAALEAAVESGAESGPGSGIERRALGRTGIRVSPISFGAWAIGGTWGPVDDAESLAALHAAVDAGVNLIDTADVYGDGRSERLIARLKRERPRDTIWVATKAGRRLPTQTPDGYTRENLTAWVERSLRNLEAEGLDLLQLHCPHTDVYDRPEVFGILDDLTREGKIRHYGVSVETVDEAQRAILHPNVQSVQIIFNMFRLKPADAFLAAAASRRVGVIARVPLASGLLTGKLRADSAFAPDDHRGFNREGRAFDKGETFSGVPYELGLEAVERLRPLAPAGATLSQLALRWILMFEAVTCAIPGAKTAAQARENVAAASLAPLDSETMARIRQAYEELIRPHVHGSW
jgi:aryl-alcohol dehydrogenase-like predicted oxidoreductase